MILLWDAKGEEPLDERSRSLLKKLLEEIPQLQQQPNQQFHADPPVLSVAPTPSGHNVHTDALKLPTPTPPAVDVVAPVKQPQPVASAAPHPLLFLAKPPSPSTERPEKSKQSTNGWRPRSHDRHSRETRLHRPPRNPPRKASNSMGTVVPIESPRTVGQPPTPTPAAVGLAMVPANPEGTPLRQKRSRLDVAGPAAIGTQGRSQLGSESTRLGMLPHRKKAERRSSACSARVRPGAPRRRIRTKGSLEQTAKIKTSKTPPDRMAKLIKQKEPPDHGSTVSFGRSTSGCSRSKRGHRKEIKDSQNQTARYTAPRNPRARRVLSSNQSRLGQREHSPSPESSRWTSSEGSDRSSLLSRPVRGSTGSSRSARNANGGASALGKPRMRTASRQADAPASASLCTKQKTRQSVIPIQHGPPPAKLAMISKRNPPVRPIALKSRPRVGGSVASAKVDPPAKKTEKKDGPLRRLKKSLGLIFHHHHHHYHHHHHSPASKASEDGGTRHKHRSLKKLLGGIFHRKSSKQTAVGGQRQPSPKQVLRHGHLHMMLEGLVRHLWKGTKRRKVGRPLARGAAGRGAAKKLHWWQRLRRRRRGSRVERRRRPLLRLGFGRKATRPGRAAAGGKKVT